VVEITKLKGKNIVDIACGDFHSLALDDQGRVYSWGGGGSSKNKGQLGHGNMKDISQPEEIKFFSSIQVKHIACGDYHTMVMTESD
jgi:alpha-tubulin suppressor-like RCC1 family protein